MKNHEIISPYYNTYETTECKTSPVVRGNHRGAIMRPSYVQGGRKILKKVEKQRFRFEIWMGSWRGGSRLFSPHRLVPSKYLIFRWHCFGTKRTSKGHCMMIEKKDVHAFTRIPSCSHICIPNCTHFRTVTVFFDFDFKSLYH